jgi:autotransporter-associated beta strand protein
LNTNGYTISLGANTLSIGDGTDLAGLILASGSAITGGILAFGTSQGVIWLSGTNPTISSEITGSAGLTFAGSGAVNLSTAADVSGVVTIDSGAVTLSAANIFAGDVAGVELGDVKSHPAAATLNLTASNALTSLNTIGSDGAINISNSAALTVGDTVNNLSSTISVAITESGAAVAGALTFDGSGLFDLSGIGSGKLSLVSGSTIVVNNSAQLRVIASEFANANYSIVLNGTSQLQFAQNGGGVFANAVSGTGVLHLIGGTLQITGANNTYSGGTTGSTLDITTANLPTVNENITDAGGLIAFDQNTSGTFTGVISDGREMGTGPMESGSLDKDDSSGDNSGNVTLAQVQAYSGDTYIEAGTLTLGVANAIADSSAVVLGRVGGGATASLVLDADNQLQSLSDNTSKRRRLCSTVMP